MLEYRSSPRVVCRHSENILSISEYSSYLELNSSPVFFIGVLQTQSCYLALVTRALELLNYTNVWMFYCISIGCFWHSWYPLGTQNLGWRKYQLTEVGWDSH